MEEKSRTRLKEEMQDLQRLGESIVKLPLDRINKIEMPEELRDAILLARTLKKHGAMRRQMQYIGTLMRKIDTEPIRRFVDDINRGSKNESREFHKFEKLRDDLMNGREGAMEQVLEIYPGVDRQHLRQLVRNAVKEKEKEQPPKASRALFRYLKELTSE
jgi:ribosome-associated protein